MTHVAQHHERVHTASKAAAATQLPAPTVAKLMARLCREGLLTSIRGVKGGYQLARPAAKFRSPRSSMRLMVPSAHTMHQIGAGRCEVEAVCPSRVGLHRINVAVNKALDDVSLADIATPVPAFQAPSDSNDGANCLYQSSSLRIEVDDGCIPADN